MLIDQETLRFIFGMKLRKHRLEKKLSLQDLAAKSKLSPSYINEIEKGKKYPKSDKILILAEALGIGFDELASVKLSSELAFLTKFLEQRSLKSLPLHIFGIPAQTILEIMSESPEKVSAFIGTLLEMARLYDIRVEEVLVACLKGYIDMHGNFFQELEDAAEKIRQELLKNSVDETRIDTLRRYLMEHDHYQIEQQSFGTQAPELKSLLFLTSREPTKKLWLNDTLTSREQSFIIAKMIGYEALGLKDYFPSSHVHASESFERLLNNFKASYFAGALLLSPQDMQTDFRNLLQSSKWQATDWIQRLKERDAPWNTYLHRMAQLLPKEFNIDRLFILEMEYHIETEVMTLSKQLHLSDLHAPHRVYAGENYCRRWITVQLLKNLAQDIKQAPQSSPVISAQRSHFVVHGAEYLCISVADRKEANSNILQCTTIGLQVDGKLADLMPLVNDLKISERKVGETCERCPINDCDERAAPAIGLQRKATEDTIQKSIQKSILHLSAKDKIRLDQGK